MKIFRELLVCGMMGVLLVSCGKSEDQYDEESGEYVTVNAYASGDFGGGYCSEQTANDFLSIQKKCTNNINNYNDFVSCKNIVQKISQRSNAMLIDCYVRVPHTENSVYHVSGEKVADLEKTISKIEKSLGNYKSGECGAFVEAEISDFYSKNVDFNKKQYSSNFKDGVRDLLKKYEGISCMSKSGVLFNEDFFTRLNLDITFGFELSE